MFGQQDATDARVELRAAFDSDISQRRVLPRPTRRPKSHFKTNPDGRPDLVLIPSGAFDMGVSNTEEEREGVPQDYRSRASPLHRVTFQSGFYLGRHAVTRGDFKLFVYESGYSIPKGCYRWMEDGWRLSADHNWLQPGFPQDDRHPVVCVNQDDVEAYLKWLSQKTGVTYRLPSEAEWERAARGGNPSARFWGEDRSPAQHYANVADHSLSRKWKVPDSPKKFFPWNDNFPFTAPVGSFNPNPFGLFDMLGNTSDWCADHWHDNYEGAPSDGSAWMRGSDFGQFVVRGSAWHTAPWSLRVGMRNRNDGTVRDTATGFRLARNL